MKETVLVTGAGGFIGRSVVRLLVEKGYRVLGLDNFRFSNRDQVFRHEAVEWIDGDTRNWPLVSSLVPRVGGVIHLAAPSSFLMHEENDLEACGLTILGFKTVMEAIRKDNRLKQIVWASTSAVYELEGTPPRVPFHEGLSLKPPDSKAGCKLWCEQEAERYHERYGIASTAFRPFSVYGTGEHTKLYYANITSLFTWAMMSGQQPVVWGNGEQTRDFIFVEDAARAFVMAMESGLPTIELNLGYGKEHTFNDVIEIAGRLLGIEPKPVHVDVPVQIYAQRLWADTSKTERSLGFRAMISLEEGIKRIVAATNALPVSVRDQLKLGVQQLGFKKLYPDKERMGVNP